MLGGWCQNAGVVKLVLNSGVGKMVSGSDVGKVVLGGWC